LEHESKLPKREAAGTIHVKTGHSSNVVIGNVSNSILATLQRAGNDELNKKLVQLTHAVQQTNELTSEGKAEALEKLEFIAAQVAEPTKRVKLSVVATVWNSLEPILKVAADLAEIYAKAAPFVTQYFGG
jgi:hypothetical protein